MMDATRFELARSESRAERVTRCLRLGVDDGQLRLERSIAAVGRQIGCKYMRSIFNSVGLYQEGQLVWISIQIGTSFGLKAQI